ncbi:hypothetical protein [Aquabacterium sp.]|jgi:hypothetical protein|uniref:hypothetical protein n=1 Tax=Aquabacterium sp. TaxID=1872578 RepID=UPI0025BA080D|nr:hypothetical protein [Aquabacterium sp.]MDQ5927200.1 hypothetical protein [Pseudomonadota bacterium]
MSWLKKSTKPCAEGRQGCLSLLGALVLALSLTGCSVPPSGKVDAPAGKAPEVPASATTSASRAVVPRVVKLPPPATPRNWGEVREQAARRMVASSPVQSYTDAAPPILLAIPVLTIELNADGSVRRIEVMRYPSQARDTVQLAMQAVRRAAPFGNVSKLPRPWRFNETFLFNEQRQFKPMTLDRR